MTDATLSTPIAPSCPVPLHVRLRQLGLVPRGHFLTVSLADQTMTLWKEVPPTLHWRAFAPPAHGLPFRRHRTFLISSSRFGIGQVEGSFQTPLGLHRIARKIGGGQPIGTVFRHRQPIGFTWEGHTDATICHRILWLEGLEPGFNQGGKVDTFRRFVYLHGFADETTLGSPQSHGCIHVAAADLLPLFDLLPAGTLVWIDWRA